MLRSKREYRDPREGEVYSFLTRHARRLSVYGEELRLLPCPSCGQANESNPSCSINQKTGLWHCHSCHKSGNWFQMTELFGDPIPLEDRYKNYNPPPIDFNLTEFFGKQERTAVSSGKYSKLLEYLNLRGLSNKTLDKWRVSSLGPEAVRIPLYQWQNGWQIVNTRIVTCLNKATKKTTNWFQPSGAPTDLLMGNHLTRYEGPKRAIIFEGQWDAMTATELGIENVYSLPNGSSSVNVGLLLRYIPEDWEIWVCSDMDRAGDLCFEKFVRQLRPDMVKRIMIKQPYKDLNEWYQKEPFLTAEEFLSGVNGTGLLSQTNASATASDTLEIDFSQTFTAPEPVCHTPWPRLTKKIQGFYPGQISGLLAMTGGGKTTFCNQLACHVACLGTKVAMVSLEDPREDVKADIVRHVKTFYDPIDHKKIGSNLSVSPLEGKSVRLEEIMSWFRRQIEKGCKFLIMDNFDHICKEDNSLKLRCVEAVLDLARRAKVHFFLVWQPRSVDRHKRLNSGDQKGYSMVLQDSANYLILNRLPTHTELLVEKCRKIGHDNRPIRLQYDADTRSYLQSPEPKTQENGKLISLV